MRFGGAGREVQGLQGEAMRLVEAQKCDTHLAEARLPKFGDTVKYTLEEVRPDWLLEARCA